MRFLILSQYFSPEVGAPQTRLAAISHELTRLGHQVEVVTALPNYPVGRIFPEFRGSFYRRDDWEGVRVHRVWLYACTGRGVKRMLNYASFAITSLYGLLRAKKPDYVFIESPPVFLSVPGFVMSRLRGVPFIFNVSDLWPDSVRELDILQKGFLLRFAYALERWTYRRAGYVNAVTEGIRAKLVEKKGVPSHKVLFLPNGVDTKLFKPTGPDREFKQQLGLMDKKIVLYQGTQGYAHGLENVLYAARLLRGDLDIHFLFVGDGSERRKLGKLKGDLGLQNMTFLEPVSRDELPRFFSIAECGLVSLKQSPLSADARPSKSLPIMASGKPVVYVGSGEGARVIEEAKAGVVVPFGDPPALAAALRTLVNDPTLADELGKNGRKHVEEHFQWSELVSSWLRQLGQSCVAY